MNSRLGSEYKIELIKILKQIMTEGYYIDEDINQEQLDKLQSQVDKLKNKLREERTKKVYGSTEIVALINVEGLLSSSLLRYMEELGLGYYKVAKVNRVFKHNGAFFIRVTDKSCLTWIPLMYEHYSEYMNFLYEPISIPKISHSDELITMKYVS